MDPATLEQVKREFESWARRTIRYTHLVRSDDLGRPGLGTIERAKIESMMDEHVAAFYERAGERSTYATDSEWQAALVRAVLEWSFEGMEQ